MSAGNRCRPCGKVIFGSRESAERAAAGITEKYNRGERYRMRVYLGPCGHWHTTRTKTLNEIRAKLGLLEQQK